MIIDDFSIGCRFYSVGGLEYLCTDIGSRTISAVLITDVDPIFYEGPPYMQQERVFDEQMLMTCHQSFENMLRQSLVSSLHPGFSCDEVRHMMHQGMSEDSRRYPRPKLLKMDKLDADDIAHPFSASRNDQIWTIHFLYLKSKQYGAMPDNEFAHLPFAHDSDIERFFKKKGQTDGSLP